MVASYARDLDLDPTEEIGLAVVAFLWTVPMACQVTSLRDSQGFAACWAIGAGFSLEYQLPAFGAGFSRTPKRCE